MRDIMYVGFEENLYLLHNGFKYGFDTQPKFGKIHLDVDRNDIESIYRLSEYERASINITSGSIALLMAQTAAGISEGMICRVQTKGHTYDIAGGYYLLHKQGFFISDMYGKPYDYKEPRNGLVVLNKDVAEEIKPIIF